MTTELDALGTALYARTDDLLKESPQIAPRRPAVGIASQLSEAELVTPHLRHLFPYLPQQPGYNKRLRAARGLVRHCIRVLAASTALWTDDAWVVDSTPVECARSRETVKRSDLAGWAQYGYCASHSRWFWGLGLHLLCTLHGLPVGFALSGAKADERQVIESVKLDLERHGGRTPDGVTVRVLQRILALTAAIWHNDATGQPVMRSLLAYDH